MVGRYCEGILPAATADGEAERALQELLVAAAANADAAMVALDFSTGITAVKEFIEAVNGYVTEQEPWVLAKDPANRARLETVLYTVCESLRAIAVLYNPLMPKKMQDLWGQLGADGLGALADQRIDGVAVWGQLPVGASVTKGDSLFPRLEEAP
jgi:methionyl-tRNA synthetase